VGFALDRQADEDLRFTRLRWYAGQRGDAEGAEAWLGLNCAACHTAEIADGDRRIRIDGGPGMGDFDALISALDAALTATRRDQAKWDRFASRVLAVSGRDTPANRTMLASAVDRLIDWQRRTEALNRPSGGEPDSLVGRAGFARVDAFGHIYNKIQLFTGDPNPSPNAADAPVSYPFLWNIHRQKKVQWNGVAENSRFSLGGGRTVEYGALGRNAGEVLGVFGEAVVMPSSANGQRLRGFRTSVNVANLDRLEALIPRLQPPAWPAERHPIRQVLVAEGRELFGSNCLGCHKTPELWKPGEPTETMLPFKRTRAKDLTDIWMACNAYTYDGPTGRLRGTRDGFVSGEPLGAKAPIVTMLSTTVKGALVGSKGEVLGVALANFTGLRRPPTIVQADEDVDAKSVRRSICMSRDDPLLAYKARPLDGIWATAPYLHNGSVPTLHDLLLPAAERPKRFRLGTRAYDFEKVGYQAMASGGTEFRVTDDRGQTVDGNDNAGHEYGVAQMTPAQRRALLEYLKTL
jgi:mono/diheme cytochrome c family protein